MRLLAIVAFTPLIVDTAAAVPLTEAPQPRPSVSATIESTLATGGRQIRQFAFDANPHTYFASERNPRKGDTLTLRFDEAVAFQAITWHTGRDNAEGPKGNTLIEEFSRDGKTFESREAFLASKPGATGEKKQMLKAVRLRATQDMAQPLVVREITLGSMPPVATFRYPVEIALDVSDAPEMRAWAENVVRVCERQYPKICEELAGKGFQPLTQLQMTFKKDYRGVAAAGGGRIVGSVKYFQAHPKDVGAMVHETVHCVQNYRGRNLPGWLVEGIADYIRFWRYEPGKAGRVSPERARYDGSYRTTAAFLAFVSDQYDARLVTKLNAHLRQGKYDPAIWKTLTGKSVEELNQQWRQSLVR